MCALVFLLHLHASRVICHLPTRFIDRVKPHQLHHPPGPPHQQNLAPSAPSPALAYYHQSQVPCAQLPAWSSRTLLENGDSKRQDSKTRSVWQEGSHQKSENANRTTIIKEKRCCQTKSKTIGCTQRKGKWYCPAPGLTLTEWKEAQV